MTFSTAEVHLGKNKKGIVVLLNIVGLTSKHLQVFTLSS